MLQQTHGKVCDVWRPAVIAFFAGGLFAGCPSLWAAVPFRRVLRWIVEPPVLCFALRESVFASLLGVCVAFLLELCELARPVEMPCLSLLQHSTTGTGSTPPAQSCQ